MFRFIASFILRNRPGLLVVMALATVFFGFYASKIELSYDFAKILPSNDSDIIAYKKFKEIYGEDSRVVVMGIKDENFFELEKYNNWYQLGNDIKNIEGVDGVLSPAHLYTLSKNTSEQKFDVNELQTEHLTSQLQVDNIKKQLSDLRFYDGMLWNREADVYVMAITISKDVLNTGGRIKIIENIKKIANAYGADQKVEMHFSGLPFIRTAVTSKVIDELKLFLFLGFLVTSFILWFFFRSFNAVIFPILVVSIAVVWSLGLLGLLGFKITVLTGLIPTLIIIIGIPNSILLLNKYQAEFKTHSNKIKALQRTIQNIGFTTFVANVTTAIGFGVFYFTKSNILMEFGLIAALNIMATYAISLILIPIIFSYLPAPKVSHVKHLKSKRTNFFLEFIDRLVNEYTNWIHASVAVLVIISVIGITKINAVGYIVDDLPHNDPVLVDLQFFEKHFKGILPLEILIDTKSTKGLNSHKNLALIYRLQKRLAKKDELSRSLSIVDGIKYAYQTYRGGNPKAYILPGSLEMNKLSSYIKEGDDERSNLLTSFVDSTKQTARISVQVADIGSKKMGLLIDDLNQEIDAIFDPALYNKTLTGNSLIFLKGNDYLVSNLVQSIILAIVLISIIMIMLFMSVRMILVSILPSLIPLIITAGLMGYFQIPLKPSTILIYSIAFGISSDGTIYFLTRYRHDMRYYSLSISRAVSRTIKETGLSMVYTAVILFAGFFIFTASGFGGTQSLGILISFTLLVAMISNLVFLPALLITLERKLTTKAFLKEPIVEVFVDKEKEEIENIEINKINNGSGSIIKNKTEV